MDNFVVYDNQIDLDTMVDATELALIVSKISIDRPISYL